MTLTPAKMRAARAMLGLTQAEMATRCGVSESTINCFETGKFKPHRATLAAMIRSLIESGVEITTQGVEFADE